MTQFVGAQLRFEFLGQRAQETTPLGGKILLEQEINGSRHERRSHDKSEEIRAREYPAPKLAGTNGKVFKYRLHQIH
ncbi:hypothetical protein [Burkholderia gladioli]|uniref:hypothetical protein n=1 Tax=Burkholderia gladioli TaxID=28095 RepID=UPI001FC7F693|nr:hypothetical protein [Burkholderia gladioli]